MFFDNYCGSYKINTLGPKRLLRTQVFERKGTLSSKEIIWPIFLVLLNITNVREQIVRVHNVFSQLLCKR